MNVTENYYWSCSHHLGRSFDKIMPPKKDFQWTDDEVELLLNVTYEYKTARPAECTDFSVCPCN